MKALFLVCLLLSVSDSFKVSAQVSTNSYAAPGMPTMLQRGLPINPPFKVKPWLTERLPRFWHTADSLARQRQAKQVALALRQRVNYPKVALQCQLEAEVVVSVKLTPTGEPQLVVIRKAAFTLPNPAPEAADALRIEAIRVAQLLRFQPYADTADSVVFPLKFSYL